MKVKISVLGYSSDGNRAQKVDATLLGVATSYGELNQLIRQPRGIFLDYVDESGNSLYLEQAEERLGYFRPPSRIEEELF